MSALRQPSTLTCRPAARSATSIVVALSIATGSAAAATAADASGTAIFDWSSASLRAMMARGYDRNPTVLLAGAAALILPVLAFVAAISRYVSRKRSALSPPLHTVDLPLGSGGAAWIEVADRRAPRLAVGELIRIGDSEDCDLALSGAGLAETHALIQRTPDREFFIIDVSAGHEANAGLAVNGAPARRRRLADGDRIEIGTASVVFRTAGPGVTTTESHLA